MERNIALIWDFDGTLTQQDSTSKTVEVIKGKGSDKKFWDDIKAMRGDSKKPSLEHVLASDAPIWMYALSRMAYRKKLPLNKEFFSKFVARTIKLFPEVENFLSKIKDLENNERFQQQNIKISHFIVTAGLKDLIEEVVKPGLVSKVFGCRYRT